MVHGSVLLALLRKSRGLAAALRYPSVPPLRVRRTIMEVEAAAGGQQLALKDVLAHGDPYDYKLRLHYIYTKSG